jgi:DNA repair protein RecN (Recombination protein N)
MLKQLSIENLALIRNLELLCHPGLTVVTGETGAGKSILVQAVEALLGNPVHAETVQTGAMVARVEGVFESPRHIMTYPEFAQCRLNIDTDQDLCMTREIHRRGRDRFLVNDQVVKKADFQWIGHQLLDVNSQHSHQYLLQSGNHLELFDRTVNQTGLLAGLQAAWDAWQRASSSYLFIKRKLDEIEKQRTLMDYQMREIDDAKLIPGEKQALIEERERLRYADEIRSSLKEACSILDTGSVPVTDNLAATAKLIQKAARRDPALTDLAERCESLSLLARDVCDDIQQAMNGVVVSPEKLNAVSDRLYFLQQLEGRFQNSVEGILEYRREIGRQMEGYSIHRNELEEMHETCRTAKQAYVKADRELSVFRRSMIPKVCRRLEKSLVDLGMRHAGFDIRVEPEWRDDDSTDPAFVPDRCTARGTDRYEFMMSANPGVPLKPLSTIASGGELSRIMLALKQHLIEKVNHRTMVFDEIDTGIGGDIANAVGEKLKMLAKDSQIFCVTHLPQIAVQGHDHFRVDKRTDGDVTHIVIENLDRSGRIREIARMLGDRTGDMALRHAENMLSAICD